MPRNTYAEKKANYPEFKQGYPEFKTGSQLVEYGNTAEQRGFGGGGSYFSKLKQNFGENLIAYLPVDDLQGTVLDEKINNWDATIANVTLQQDGYRGKSGLFGTTSYGNGNTIGANMNLNEGSIILWIKKIKESWYNDGDYIFNLSSATDYIRLKTAATADRQIIAEQKRGTTYKNNYFECPYSDSWIQLAVTWSTTLNRTDIYFNGALYYDAFAGVTSIGSSIETINRLSIGSASSTSASSSLDGNLCHIALINRYATIDEIRTLNGLNQIIFDGDSRTIGKNWPLAAISPNVVIPRNVAKSGATVQDRIDNAPTNVDAKIIAGKRNMSVIFAGTNSQALTDEQIYNQLKSYCLARRTAGFSKIAVCTEIDSQDATHISNNWPTKYLALNTRLRNGYTEFADYLIDLGSNVNLQNSLNTTYFNADKLHLTVLGQLEVGKTAQPIINQMINS